VELYYKHVCRANPAVWRSVCEYHAQGEKWPSLHELKTSLANARGYVQEGVQAITDARGQQGEPMPEEVRAFINKSGNVGKGR
jgi:cytochrome c556